MIDPLLPEPLGLAWCHVQIMTERIVILTRTTSVIATCPDCGPASSRIHSRYTATLADGPWHGRPVQLLPDVRRFTCDTDGRCRRIFAGRVPQVAGLHARQTVGLVHAWTGIAFTRGGEDGAHLIHDIPRVRSVARGYERYSLPRWRLH